MKKLAEFEVTVVTSAHWLMNEMYTFEQVDPDRKKDKKEVSPPAQSPTEGKNQKQVILDIQ